VKTILYFDLTKKMGQNSEKQLLKLGRRCNSLDTDINGDIKEVLVNSKVIKDKLSTHVLITSSIISRALKGNDPNIHIADHFYFYRPIGFVYNKDLDSDIIDPLEKM